MSKSYKFFKPNFYTGAPPEGSYRSIFKWGDVTRTEILDEYLFIFLKQRYGLTNEDFTRQRLGLEQVEEIPKTPLNKEKQQKLIKVFGEKVSFEAYDRVRATYSGSVAEINKLRTGTPDNLPAAVIFPETEEDIAAALEIAKKIEVKPGIAGGKKAEGRLLLDLRKYNKVLKFNEPDQLITVQAGIGAVDLERILNNAPENFDVNRRYTTGFNPSLFEVSTAGGWVAARQSSASSPYYGGIEDIVHSFRIVTDKGVVDTSAYDGKPHGLNLGGLFFGQAAEFGVVSSVTLKFFKRVVHNDAAFCLVFKSFGAGEQAARDIIQAQSTAPVELILSDPAESAFIMDSKGIKNNLFNIIFGFTGIKRGQACFLTAKATGTRAEVKAVKKAVMRAKRRYRGTNLLGFSANYFGRDRLDDAYIRETLMDFGFVCDYADCFLPYSKIPAVHAKIEEYAQDFNVRAAERGFTQVEAMSSLVHFDKAGAMLRTSFLCPLGSGKTHAAFLQGLKDLHVKQKPPEAAAINKMLKRYFDPEGLF